MVAANQQDREGQEENEKSRTEVPHSLPCTHTTNLD